MIAAHFNIQRSEAELLPLCGTTENGTLGEDLAQAATLLGLSATISYDDPAMLNQTLSRSLPLTVFVGIPFDLATNFHDMHSVVVIALENNEVVYLDPLDGLEHRQPYGTFLNSWEYGCHIAIVITPSR